MLAFTGAVHSYDVVLLSATMEYVLVSAGQAPTATPLMVPAVPGSAVLVTAFVRAALVPEQLEDTTLTLPETKVDANSTSTLKLP